MTTKEFNNLAIGDLVIYVGGSTKPYKNKERNRCTGLVLQVAETNVKYEGNYGNIRTGVKLVQPFVKSDFEMYVSGKETLQFYNL